MISKISSQNFSSIHFPNLQKEQTAKVIGLIFFGIITVYGRDNNKYFSIIASCCFGLASLFILNSFKKNRIQRERIHSKPLIEISQLTWKEMIFLINPKHSFGLRIAGSLQEAQIERSEGFFGDSLNLDILSPNTWKLLQHSQKIDAGSNFSENELLLLWPEQVNEERREELLLFWEKGVKAFLNCAWVNEQSALLLIDYGPGGKGSYDNKVYGEGLGKKGKQYIEPSQIVALISPLNNKRDIISEFYKRIVSEIATLSQKSS